MNSPILSMLIAEKHTLNLSNKMHRFLYLIVLILTTSCSDLIDRLDRNDSGVAPKKDLIAPLIPASKVTGSFHAPIERSSPLVIADRVYVGSVHDRFMAIRKSSGKIIWQKKIEGGVESSPIYFNNKIYFGANDGIFYCLDSESGKTIWSYPVKVEMVSQPLLVGSIVYFTTIQNTIYALKAETGEWVWYYNKGYTQKISIRGSSTPVYYDGKVYAGFSDGYLYAFNAFNGESVWYKKLSEDGKFSDVDMMPILEGNQLIAGSSDGSLYLLDATNGNIQWKKNYWDMNGIIADQKHIYITQTSGNVICLSKKNGEKVWDHKLKGGIPLLPILVEDQLIIGTSDRYVFSISTENGNEIWRYTIGTGMAANPVFHDEKLFLFSNLAVLHVIDPFYLVPNS